MSRSTRRPYMAVTGNSSAKSDKRLANKGVRRAHKASLKTCTDFENFLLPHRLECHWNEVYGWSRDGKQWDFSHYADFNDPSEVQFYRKLLRK
jgi:hypothetical protein